MAGFDTAVAQILSKGRDLTIEKIVNGDHAFSQKAGDYTGLLNVFSHVVDWFMKPR